MKSIKTVEVTCDKCGRDFFVHEKMLKGKKLNYGDNTEVRYFNCPMCEAEYLINVLDNPCRKLIKLGKRKEAAERAEKLKQEYNCRKSLSFRNRIIPEQN